MALLALVYAAAAVAGRTLGLLHGTVAPVWPPCGVALAALLLYGVELWPGVAVGSAVASALAGNAAPVILGEVAGATLAAVIPALLLRRTGFRPQLDRFTDVVRLVVYGALLGPLIDASLGTLVHLEASLDSQTAGRFWLTWILGDVGGVLILSPALFTWLSRPAMRAPGRRQEGLLLFGLLVVGCFLGFGVSQPFLLPVFPIALWAAVRFGPRSASAASLLVLATAIWFAWHGVGPFARRTPTESLIFFQSFSLTLALTGMLLAASTVERRRSGADLQAAQDRYRALTEASSIATVVLDPADRVLGWSRAAPRLFGWSETEVLGKPLPTVPADQVEVHQLAGADRGNDLPEGREVIRLRKDGSRVEVVASFWPLRAADGKGYATMGVYRDVTAGKESERVQRALYRISEAAHTSPSVEALFSEIHAVVGDLMPARNFYIALHDPATNTLSFPYFVDEKDPPPAPRRLGKGLTEYVLRSGQPLLDRPGVVDELVRRGEVLSIGAPSSDWLGVPLKTGGRTIGVLTAQSYDAGVRYTEHDRDILQFVSTQVAMAIERKRAEEALRASEGELRAVFSAMRDVILVLDADGRYQKVAPTNPGLLYQAADQLLGRTLHEVFPREQADQFKELIDRALSSGGVVHGEYALPIGDRSVWFAATVSPMTVNTVVWVARDITEQKGATEALAESERRYRVLARQLQQSQDRFELFVQTTNDVLWDWDLTTDAIWWAPTLTNLLGFHPDEFQGDTWTRLLHPEDRDRVWSALRAAIDGTAKAWSEEYRIQRRDGGYAHLLDRASIQRDAAGRAVRMVGAMMDATERKEAEEALRHSEEQLRQAMKMEAVGRLAGGVAHDFNNLLTAVLGHADLVLAQVDPSSALRDDIQEIKSAALRAAGLTQQLLAFSRKQVLERRVVDLNQIVAGITRMLDRTIGEDIRLVTDLAPELGRVHADAVQLEQVLLNLAVNARDAMPEGGRLTIETLNVHLESGPAVRIRVADTGVGMTPEVLAHIFEPFFTTKELGKGTGLGLATVYGIVKQSGGHISVSSSRGQGTTFLIDFPRAADRPQRVDVAAPVVERRSTGTETILLVEDEEAVRTLARRVLEQRGYQVLAAGSAEEALQVSRSYLERIDLLLTDVVMPGESGPKLAERLMGDRRVSAVVYMSGYAATAVEQRLLLDDSAPFIQKPFTPDLLARRVREVLDAVEQPRAVPGAIGRT
jgi:PAS domain S-box-containing protein